MRLWHVCKVVSVCARAFFQVAQKLGRRWIMLHNSTQWLRFFVSPSPDDFRLFLHSFVVGPIFGHKYMYKVISFFLQYENVTWHALTHCENKQRGGKKKLYLFLNIAVGRLSINLCLTRQSSVDEEGKATKNKKETSKTGVVLKMPLFWLITNKYSRCIDIITKHFRAARRCCCR